VTDSGSGETTTGAASSDPGRVEPDSDGAPEGFAARYRGWILIAAGVAVGVIVVAVILVMTTGGKRSTTGKEATGKHRVSWTHNDLAGKTVVVLPGSAPTQQFSSKPDGTMVPTAVVSIDAAFAKDGCGGGQKQFNLWKAKHGATQASLDRTSAYASYALNEGRSRNCSWASAA
jgi:hypothetical protein